jgi:hypothetical protein
MLTRVLELKRRFGLLATPISGTYLATLAVVLKKTSGSDRKQFK